MTRLDIGPPLVVDRFRLIPVEVTTVARRGSTRWSTVHAFKRLHALVIQNRQDGDEHIYALGPDGETMSLEALIERLPEIGDALGR